VPIDDYRRALEAAIDEYERLKAEREQIETRLAQLRQTIGALAPLCELPRPEDLGLTDACRSVLRARFGPLTPVQVKDDLVTMGLDLSTYSNPLASIHAVLKRLAGAGEVIRLKTRGKKTVYAWKRPTIPIAVTGVRNEPIVTGGASWSALRTRKPKEPSGDD
jgi:hypothetical protein